jgi:hypothetical protein
VKAAASLCILVLMTSNAPATGRRSSPSRHPVLRRYRKKVLGKESAARTLASGSINTARNHPHEWGGGVGGFTKRVGSAFGQHLVSGTIEVGVGALHHEDLRYRRSHLQGTWPRLKYAVKSTFIVPRTDKRGKTLAAGRIAGNFGGGLVSRAWQPASAAGIGAGLASGGIGIGADVGFHVAREFWPRGTHGARHTRSE